MGVLACDRSNCERIMCERISDEHGYICGECFEELVKSGVTTDVEEFMQSKKRNTSDEGEAAEFRFNNLFRKFKY